MTAPSPTSEQKEAKQSPTPYDWLGGVGYSEAIMRLQAKCYIRACHTIATMSWWRRRRYRTPESVVGYHGGIDFTNAHYSDYMTDEIMWAHSAAFPHDSWHDRAYPALKSDDGRRAK